MDTTAATEIVTKPGWNANGDATLAVTRRTRAAGNLDFTDKDVAYYCLGVLDGEITLVKYEGTSDEAEIVYSEIFNTDAGLV